MVLEKDLRGLKVIREYLSDGVNGLENRRLAIFGGVFNVFHQVIHKIM